MSLQMEGVKPVSQRHVLDAPVSSDSEDEYARQLEEDLLNFEEESPDDADLSDEEGLAEATCLVEAPSSFAGPRASEQKLLQHNLESCGEPLKKRLRAGDQEGEATSLGCFVLLPAEVLMHVMKFFSAEDLSTIAGVNRTFRALSSEEGLWRSLYCNRWGPPPATDQRRSSRVRRTGWKQLYFERDSSEMRETLRTAPSEFREIYGQMAAAKRSQAPAVHQVHQVRSGDFVKVDTSIAEQISAWKAKQTFETGTGRHVCSGQRCSYHRIGDVFLCERTGNIHVCDETCRETVSDPSSDLLVCSISGRCFDRWVEPAEEEEAGAQRRAAEEQDVYLGPGQLAQAYYLGYDCSDEKELDAALSRVMYSC